MTAGIMYQGFHGVIRIKQKFKINDGKIYLTMVLNLYKIDLNF